MSESGSTDCAEPPNSSRRGMTEPPSINTIPPWAVQLHEGNPAREVQEVFGKVRSSHFRLARD